MEEDVSDEDLALEECIEVIAEIELEQEQEKAQKKSGAATAQKKENMFREIAMKSLSKKKENMTQKKENINKDNTGRI